MIGGGRVCGVMVHTPVITEMKLHSVCVSVRARCSTTPPTDPPDRGNYLCAARVRYQLSDIHGGPSLRRRTADRQTDALHTSRRDGWPGCSTMAQWGGGLRWLQAAWTTPAGGQ